MQMVRLGGGWRAGHRTPCHPGERQGRSGQREGGERGVFTVLFVRRNGQTKGAQDWLVTSVDSGLWGPPLLSGTWSPSDVT